MNPYALPSLISVVPFAFLALAALLHDPQSRSNRLLFLICSNCAVFVGLVGLFHLSSRYESALFWNKWPYLTLLPACILMIRYTLEISGREESLQTRFLGFPVRYHLWIGYGVIFFYWLVVLFTDLLIAPPVHYAKTGWEHAYGALFIPFNLSCYYLLALLIAVIKEGIRAADSPIVRMVRTNFLYSLGGGLSAAFILGMILPMLGYHTHSFSTLPFLFMCLGWTYGLLRQQWETIRQLNLNLEGKVAERTKELEIANQQLISAQEQISKYIDPKVTEKIFKGEFAAKLTHRRVKLTICFTDIKDFTQFTDASDPEDVARLLNEYLGEMAEIVRRWGGTIPQFTGDSIFAIFGAPDSLGVSEDALACARMAVEMQARMGELRNKWWSEGIQHPFTIRCGIHTGMANVGNYGSEGFMEYSAIGLNTNLASRLEQACEPGEIYVSHATWALIKEAIPCEEVGTIEVKGFHYLIKTYRILQEQVNLTLQERAAPRSSSPTPA
ncbi:MAG: adenylate/guanylate cyclase domain-containing protein [candidate division NC10 bacterium]|nr:adenylate/guanylate cyclase domain-containing protein [candidate division NC10 bacterium]